MTAETVPVGLLVVAGAVGVVGVVVPVLPGPLLVLAGIALWAVSRRAAVGRPFPAWRWPSARTAPAVRAGAPVLA